MDIVERLREVLVNTMHWVKCHDAADEIERLRQDKAELLDALKHIVRWHDQLSANDIAKAKAAIAKATGEE